MNPAAADARTSSSPRRRQRVSYLLDQLCIVMQAGLFASLFSVHNDTSASLRVYIIMDALDEFIGVANWYLGSLD